MMLSDVYLSVCRVQKYIGPKSRTERPRKTKIGIYVAHVTRDSDTTFKVKRSQVKVTRPLYSPLHLHIRQLQRWAWERVGREKLLLHCRLLGCMRRFGLGAYCGGRLQNDLCCVEWDVKLCYTIPPTYSLFYMLLNSSNGNDAYDMPLTWLALF